jgi:ABC-type uncharacterized transport system substrate-binding protein
MPVVGFLSILSSSYIASRMPSFRQGLKEAGYIEGQNVAIEYRVAEGHYDRLPDMAADLVGRQVAAIVTAGIDPTKVAKAATATLPIVFLSDVDPVNAGIVTSLNWPGGNVTGVSLLGSALEAKRLGLLNEIVSGTAPIGVLLDPGFPDANLELRELQDAASAIKRQIIVERVSNGPEIDAAYATVARRGRARSLLRKMPSSVTASTSSRLWRPAINCPRCTHSVNLPKRAVSSVTGPTLRTGIAKQGSMSQKFSRASNRPTCRFCNRPSSSLSSISRPPRPWA